MTYPAQRSGHPPRPAAPPYPEDPTTATRHLCAAAYIDDDFRDISLRAVYNRPRRLIAPSYGFDLVPVLSHCLKARHAAMWRDGAILLTLLIALTISWGTLLGVVAIMGGVQVVVGTYRLARDTFQELRLQGTIKTDALIPRAVLLGVGWIAVIVAVVWLGGLAAADLVSSSFGGESNGTGPGLLASFFMAGLIFAYPIAFSLWRQTELSHLAPGKEVTVPVRTPRLDEIYNQQRGNTVVYSGYHPFVGSGARFETWSFAQRLVRPQPSFAEAALNGAEPRHAAATGLSEGQREFEQPPFDAEEVLDYLRADLQGLSPREGTEAEEQIPGLYIEDKVFLAGTEVSRLSPYTDPETMSAIIRHPTTPARHYLTCQVFSWGGELMTTVYVHIAVQGRSLFIEMTSTVLPPTEDAYRIVDTVEGTGSRAWLRALRTGIVDTPRTIWRSPVALAGAIVGHVASSGAEGGGTGRLVRGYDYGAVVGVRELACRGGMRNLVQLLDFEKYQKLIERRVIAAVLDFLDQRGVDTTEYRARAASVLSVNNLNNIAGGVGSIGDNNTFRAPVTGTQNGSGGKA